MMVRLHEMDGLRREHLVTLYETLDKLEKNIGPARKLADCSGRAVWPQRGVYFFREPGEHRHETGTGPRVVRVGTHALKRRATTKLWTRLSQHKGHQANGGGNHRGSRFRLLVGAALIKRDFLHCPTWGKGNTASSDVRDKELPLEREVSRLIVIQCAARKKLEAGRLVSESGEPVVFVAQPRRAPADPAREYARPDDPSPAGVPWREVLWSYNEREKTRNPLRLCPAYRLYDRPIYERLVKAFGLRDVYILSAGWGLIAADFLTPYYDITFSQMAEPYKRRNATDRYCDFCMLPDDTTDEVVFFGGRDYLQLFASLTQRVKGRRTMFYNSEHAPQLPGVILKRFKTNTKTNWHYECAEAFLAGKITLCINED